MGERKGENTREKQYNEDCVLIPAVHCAASGHLCSTDVLIYMLFSKSQFVMQFNQCLHFNT